MRLARIHRHYSSREFSTLLIATVGKTCIEKVRGSEPSRAKFFVDKFFFSFSASGWKVGLLGEKDERTKKG